MLAVLLADELTGGTFLERLLLLFGLVESHAEFWLWLTLVLMVVEIFTSGFFLGAVAVSSALTAGVAWAGVGYKGQLVAFSLIGIGSLFLLRPIAMKFFETQPAATNTDALRGRTATVVDQVPAGGVGRVRLSNEEWRATADTTLHVGAAVRVLDVKGNTLTVGPA